MNCLRVALAWGIVLIQASVCLSREPIALLEVKVGKDCLKGRIAAHDEQTCWLLERDGRLASFRTEAVTDFHEIDTRFRPYSSLDFRDRLQAEFGRSYEVKTTAHYVVVARRETANHYAALFERIYRQFHTYFTTRGFRMDEPEFPMVAVVLPDQKTFVDYCLTEGTRPKPGLVGFYLPASNRVALYDRTAEGQTEDDVDGTVIHEGTHQVAFNTGVHSRIGQSPQWLVEGLATLFEADGIRTREVSAEVRDRTNPERLQWFREFRQQRRQPDSLEEFVANDELFKKSTLDAYSQAWALTFYLAESRPVEFAKYLKSVSTRNPLAAYDSDSRVKDFRDHFGRDLALIEAGMLRFFDRLGN